MRFGGLPRSKRHAPYGQWQTPPVTLYARQGASADGSGREIHGSGGNDGAEKGSASFMLRKVNSMPDFTGFGGLGNSTTDVWMDGSIGNGALQQQQQQQAKAALHQHHQFQQRSTSFSGRAGIPFLSSSWYPKQQTIHHGDDSTAGSEAARWSVPPSSIVASESSSTQKAGRVSRRGAGAGSGSRRGGRTITGSKVGLGSGGAGSGTSRRKPSSSIENDGVLPKPISWPDLSKMNMVGELHCAAAVAAEAAAVAAAAGGGRWYSTSIERRPSTKQWHRR